MYSQKYQRTLGKDRKISQELSFLISETSRRASLAKEGMSPHHQTIWNTGAAVIGPVFFLFVSWLLEEARKMGLKRLYFDSRDGQILLKIAELISRKQGYSIELRYLYISRRSLFLPSISGNVKNQLEWIKRREFIDISISEICRRVEIRPVSIRAELERYGFGPDAWQRNLSRSEIKKARKCFFEPSIKKRIDQNEKIALEAAAGYLKQEKMTENASDFGVVDLGWSGQLLDSLNRVLKKAGHGDRISFNGFYFALWSEVKSLNRIAPFITAADAVKMIRRMNNRVLIEVLASADHGMVIGYEKQGHRYVPVLSTIGVRETLQWGIRAQQRSTLKFVEMVPNTFHYDQTKHREAQWIAFKLLDAFLSDPSCEEADAYGKYFFSEKETEDDFGELAPMVTSWQIVKWLLGFKKIEKNVFFWLNGSLKRSRLKCSRFWIGLIKMKLQMKKVNVITGLIWMKIGVIKIAKFFFPGLVEKIKMKTDRASS